MTIPDGPFKWLTFCKMTCRKGSEEGRCPCKRPIDCLLRDHPDYSKEVAKAIKLMCKEVK